MLLLLPSPCFSPSELAQLTRMRHAALHPDCPADKVGVGGGALATSIRSVKFRGRGGRGRHWRLATRPLLPTRPGVELWLLTVTRLTVSA